ncbi:uncharacterized protein LOC132313479 [Cornus florida]|uniref:uncharacterized protein LOC132313479 n=1 Tax=Cornus florida TaxID=4283 RepID=UPI0028A23833|nr:uncharacterized protein LOC132313479 [Cornus florida]
MLKRQETLLSSSSHRETVSENQHAKAIGCMSGILQLVSKYHRRRRKFLTFGRKQEKNAVPGASKAVPQPQAAQVCDKRRFSCDVPRSPTIPAEIRRSNSPPAVVERVMGSEKITAAEERRKLMGALEKCDEELKALKKIIESVRSSEHLKSPPVTVKKCLDFNCEQPSPVSVLDEFITRSPLISERKRHSNGRVAQQHKQQSRKKPGEEDIVNVCFLNRVATEPFEAKHEPVVATPLWSSRAMVESVEQVCRDIAWGEKREVGRIGLALQDHICRDLIEEIVKELKCCCVYSLPLEACKRRLSF